MGARATEPTKEAGIPNKTIELAARRADGTLVDVVQVKVRDAILEGVYQPGQRLPLSSIAAHYAVSPTVLREVLSRLTYEGLVQSEAMQGFRVASISVADLDEIVVLLKALMPIAIRDSVAHGGAEWEASLVAAHYLFKRAVEEGSPRAQRAVSHRLFLEALTSACGNVRMIALLATLWRSNMLYHRMATELLKHEEATRLAICGEIVQLAIKGDAEGVTRLMIDKVETAARICRAHLMAEMDAVPAKRRKNSGGRSTG